MLTRISKCSRCSRRHPLLAFGELVGFEEHLERKISKSERNSHCPYLVHGVSWEHLTPGSWLTTRLPVEEGRKFWSCCYFACISESRSLLGRGEHFQWSPHQIWEMFPDCHGSEHSRSPMSPRVSVTHSKGVYRLQGPLFWKPGCWPSVCSWLEWACFATGVGRTASRGSSLINTRQEAVRDSERGYTNGHEAHESPTLQAQVAISLANCSKKDHVTRTEARRSWVISILIPKKWNCISGGFCHVQPILAKLNKVTNHCKIASRFPFVEGNCWSPATQWLSLLKPDWPCSYQWPVETAQLSRIWGTIWNLRVQNFYFPSANAGLPFCLFSKKERTSWCGRFWRLTLQAWPSCYPE